MLCARALNISRVRNHVVDRWTCNIASEILHARIACRHASQNRAQTRSYNPSPLGLGPQSPRSQERSGNKHVRLGKSRSKTARKPLPARDEQVFDDGTYDEQLLQLRDALQQRDAPKIERFYKALCRYDTSRTEWLGVHIVKELQTALQKSPVTAHRPLDPELVELADLIVYDTQSGNLPPNTIASATLIDFFRQALLYDKAEQFWLWLAQQSPEHCDEKVYGAAIVLLTARGRSGEEAEALYAAALQKFPGTFHEYHLSPHAMLSDRRVACTIDSLWPTMGLLNGIVHARLTHGNTISAYYGLDTALRLYPSLLSHQSSRLLSDFVEQRPVIEAYKLWLAACRSGSAPMASIHIRLLQRLRILGADRSGPAGNILRAAVTSLYAYVGAGGTMTSKQLNEMSICLASILQRCNDPTLEPARRTFPFVALIKKLFVIFAKHRAQPTISTFNNLIHNAGESGNAHLIPSLLHDMRDLDLAPSDSTMRSLVQAAASTGDVDSLRMAWSRLIDRAEAAGMPVSLQDWRTFATATTKCNAGDLLHGEMQRLPHAISPAITTAISDARRKATAPMGGHFASPKNHDYETTQLLDDLWADLNVLEALVDRESDHDFYRDPLTSSLQPDIHGGSYHGSPQMRLRELYDVLTTEKATLANEAVGTVASTTTANGFPLDALRFEHWKTINQCMALAETHDSALIAALDARPDRAHDQKFRDQVWRKCLPLQHRAPGSSDCIDLEGRNTSRDDGIALQSDRMLTEQEIQGILRRRGQSLLQTPGDLADSTTETHPD